jgi:hypothetical protein
MSSFSKKVVEVFEQGPPGGRRRVSLDQAGWSFA